MGNFKKVKLYIESTGFIYTTDENDIEGWEQGLMQEDEGRVLKVEVIEEYQLTPRQIKYVESDEINPKIEKQIENAILAQSRDKKITLLLKRDL